MRLGVAHARTRPLHRRRRRRAQSPLPPSPCALSVSPSSLQVVIYAPARTPSQQGMSNTATSLGKGGAWRIEFETKPK